MKSERPKDKDNPPSHRPVVHFSLIYQWVTESEDADLLTLFEMFVLMTFLRKAIKTQKDYIQETVTDILKHLPMSVNTFLKAVDGLERHGLLQKVRDPEDSRAPITYVFTLPPSKTVTAEGERIETVPSTPWPPSEHLDAPGDLKEVLRVLLFLSGDPLSISRLVALTSKSPLEIRKALSDLKAEMEPQSLHLRELATGYQISSRPEFYHYASKVKNNLPAGLTDAEREVISIVYGAGPITRYGIGKMRGGIQPMESLNSLEKRKFVKRHDRENRPPLFSLTKEAIAWFGLKDPSEMPDLQELRRAAIERFQLQEEVDTL